MERKEGTTPQGKYQKTGKFFKARSSVDERIFLISGIWNEKWPLGGRKTVRKREEKKKKKKQKKVKPSLSG